MFAGKKISIFAENCRYGMAIQTDTQKLAANEKKKNKKISKKTAMQEDGESLHSGHSDTDGVPALTDSLKGVHLNAMKPASTNVMRVNIL